MAESPKVKQLKGWFLGLGRGGDRTIEQQMTGLDKVVAEVAGKTVLDAGCAEGLVSMKLAEAGAASCVGLELIPSFVEIGNAHAGALPCKFFVANLNDDDLSKVEPADIVLMLAILHKCKDPTAVCQRLAGLAKDLCVIRLPPSGPLIVDDRSGRVPHDIDAVMTAAGFALEFATTGPIEEWLGYYRRQAEIRIVRETVSPTLARALFETQRFSEVEVAKAFWVPLEIAQTGSDHTDDSSAPPGMVPTGVKLTEGDTAADLADETRPDNPGRASWADATTAEPAEPNAKPPEQVAVEEAERVAETGDTTPSTDPAEPVPDEGIETGKPLFPNAARRRAKADSAT